MRALLIAALLLMAGCLESGDEPEPEMDDDGMDEVEHNHDPLTFSDSGTILLGTQSVDACGAVGGPLDTVSFTWEVPEEPAYRDLVVDLQWGITGLDLDLFVTGPNGMVSATSFNPLDGVVGETVTIQGVLKPGAYSVDVIGCVSAATDFTVTGEAAPIDDHE